MFINVCFSQEHLLKITNTVSNETTSIKENKRIRIITVDGKKLSGKFRIFDETSIIIDNQIIKLDSIVKLKRHPIYASLLVDVLLVYYGIGTTAVGILVAGLIQEPALLILTVPGILMTRAGCKGVSILGSYKIKDNWKYEIQMNKAVSNPEILPINNK